MPVFRSKLSLVTKKMNNVQESIVDLLIRERKEGEIHVPLHARCNMLELKNLLEEVLKSCEEEHS